MTEELLKDKKDWLCYLEALIFKNKVFHDG